jgi:hypothetical protein
MKAVLLILLFFSFHSYAVDCGTFPQNSVGCGINPIGATVYRHSLSSTSFSTTESAHRNFALLKLQSSNLTNYSIIGSHYVSDTSATTAVVRGLSVCINSGGSCNPNGFSINTSLSISQGNSCPSSYILIGTFCMPTNSLCPNGDCPPVSACSNYHGETTLLAQTHTYASYCMLIDGNLCSYVYKSLSDKSVTYELTSSSDTCSPSGPIGTGILISEPIPDPYPDPLCGVLANQCLVGNLSSNFSNDTHYNWQCTSGVKVTSCSALKSEVPPPPIEYNEFSLLYNKAKAIHADVLLNGVAINSMTGNFDTLSNELHSVEHSISNSIYDLSDYIFTDLNSLNSNLFTLNSNSSSNFDNLNNKVNDLNTSISNLSNSVNDFVNNNNNNNTGVENRLDSIISLLSDDTAPELLEFNTDSIFTESKSTSLKQSLDSKTKIYTVSDSWSNAYTPFSSNRTCPAPIPIIFDAVIPLDFFCLLAEKLSYLILFIAWLQAARIVAGAK